MIWCVAVNGRLRCANRPYVVWGWPAISCLAGLVTTPPPYPPPTSPRLHPGFTQLHFPLTYPFYLLPTDKWACLPLGWRGLKRGEQDDEILDQIRAGRGLDTGGELLGRQRAGSSDTPLPGWCRAGADSRPGCGSPEWHLFLVSGESAVCCYRAQHFRAWIAAFYSKRCRGLRGILLIYTGWLVRGAVGITPVRVGYCA